MGRIMVEERRDVQLSHILDESTLDPRMHYRFIQVRSKRVSQAKRMGYVTVDRDEHGVRTLAGDDQDDGSGAIVDGDTVLMMIPKDRHERRRRDSQRKRISRLRSADRRFRQLAEESGIRVAEDGVGREPE